MEKYERHTNICIIQTEKTQRRERIVVIGSGHEVIEYLKSKGLINTKSQQEQTRARMRTKVQMTVVVLKAYLPTFSNKTVRKIEEVPGCIVTFLELPESLMDTGWVTKTTSKRGHWYLYHDNKPVLAVVANHRLLHDTFPKVVLSWSTDEIDLPTFPSHGLEYIKDIPKTTQVHVLGLLSKRAMRKIQKKEQDKKTKAKKTYR